MIAAAAPTGFPWTSAVIIIGPLSLEFINLFTFYSLKIIIFIYMFNTANA